MSNYVQLYTDGACSGNPGPGGTGYVLIYYKAPEGGGEAKPNAQIEHGQGYKLTTNNRMEIMAGISGIRTIIANLDSGNQKDLSYVNIFSDSKYFCDAVNQRWIDKWQQNDWVTSTKTQVKNRDLWEKLLNVLSKIRSFGTNIQINHIPGHQGFEFNEMADKLATDAVRSNDKITDEVYEKSNKQGVVS